MAVLLHALTVVMLGSASSLTQVPPQKDGRACHGAAAPGDPVEQVDFALNSPRRRVRALSGELDAVFRDAVQRSPTFARLVATLQSTDVIVQIVASPQRGRPTPAQLTFIGDVAGIRWLRVHVDVFRGRVALASLVGHELYHALEIANAPQVRSRSSLAALYRRIGFGREQRFDTDAALEIEGVISRELGRRVADTRGQDAENDAQGRQAPTHVRQGLYCQSPWS